MSDELDPTPGAVPQDPNSTQPMQEGIPASQFNQVPTDPASAVAAFMEWLQLREERTGPFSVHYAVEAGNALVDKFCVAQGWIAVALDEAQVEQVKGLRAKYPD